MKEIKQVKNKRRVYPGTSKEIISRKSYTLSAAAECCQITERALTKAFKRKEVRGKKTDSGYRFTGRALLDYLEGDTPRVGSSGASGRE